MRETHKILVVDDSESNRLLLKTYLKQAGYESHECSSGYECIEYCRQVTPAAVLLDIMMPEIDGLTTCEEIRKVHSREVLPIILVTTCSESEMITDGFSKGANDYVNKPVDRRVLLARLSTHLDVTTSRRQLARALEIQRALGEMLPEGLFLQTLNGEVALCNQHMTKYCDGREPQNTEELCAHLFQGAFAADLKAHLAKLEEESNNIREYQKSGVCIQVMLRPIHVNEENYILWVIRDVTEIRELERKLHQQVKLDTVGIFASGVAHNFNNILGGILGATEIIGRAVTGNSKIDRLTNSIKNAIDSGTKLTDKMSSLSRGQGLKSYSVHEMQQLVTNIYEINTLLGLKHVELKVKADVPSKKVQIQAINLEKLFANLMQNSIDAIDSEGEIVVQIHTDFEEHQLLIDIKDNGAGMNHEVLDRIYEPFFSTKNLDVKNRVSMDGNGLGMWNVYNLVKMASGEINIKSQPGYGTEVSLCFPLADESLEDGADETTPPQLK